MPNSGWIKIYRDLLNWGWYSNGNTTRVFLDLLLNASFQENEYLGTTFKPGQVNTSIGQTAKRLGLTVQEVKTAIAHLQSTCEITTLNKKKYLLVTITKWSDYQVNQTEDQISIKSQSNLNQISINHSQEVKEVKEGLECEDLINSNINPNTENGNQTAEGEFKRKLTPKIKPLK